MAERIDPAELDRQLGTEFAEIAGEFALLGQQLGEDQLVELSVDEVTEYDGDRAEQQLGEARNRFESSIAHALAKEKGDDYGWRSHGPYDAVGDDGQVYAVRLMHTGNSDISSPYNLYKLFTTRVYVDEAAGTSTEHYREFWYISGSEYRHIPNGLGNKREYMIVRPIEGGAGKLTYIEDKDNELTQLNRLSHLVRQSPAHQVRKQHFGETMLRRVRRRPLSD